MNNSICGVDCSKCPFKDTCSGCIATKGHPFEGDCTIAKCCEKHKQENCSKCSYKPCKLKEKLIEEFNALGIEDMERVTDLNALKGSFVNLQYTLENGEVIKLLDDKKIYLGNQICKKNSNRCYGLAADESKLLVCEYGEGGCDGEIIIYKKLKF